MKDWDLSNTLVVRHIQHPINGRLHTCTHIFQSTFTVSYLPFFPFTLFVLFWLYCFIYKYFILSHVGIVFYCISKCRCPCFYLLLLWHYSWALIFIVVLTIVIKCRIFARSAIRCIIYDCISIFVRNEIKRTL